MCPIKQILTRKKAFCRRNPLKAHYLPLDSTVNIPVYLVWASWVRNGTTFPSDNRYFEIHTLALWIIPIHLCSWLISRPSSRGIFVT